MCHIGPPKGFAVISLAGAQATLSIATESSYCSAPCHFDRASHCHFDRARPIVMLSEAKHLSHHSAHCHFDRAERVEKSGMLSAAPSSEYTVSDDYSAGAAGSSTPKGSPRAWLLPFSPLLCIPTCLNTSFWRPLCT